MTNPFAPNRSHQTLAPGEKPKPKAKRRRRSESEEARIQKVFVKWARSKRLEVQHQNNGANTKAERVRLHALGCAAGAADLIIMDRLPNDPGARGLALEFKTPTGEQSDAQVRWERRVVALGWRYHLVRSVDQAKSVVQKYGLAL